MPRGAGPEKMKRKRGDSNFWKGVCIAAPLVEKGLKRVVRNGQTTNFWLDCWLGDESLRERAIGPLNRKEDSKRVADFWTVNEGWDWNAMDIIINQDTRNHMAAYILVNDRDAKDEVGWKGIDDNLFSVKSAYNSLTDRTCNEDNTSWKSILRVRVPNRIRAFAWLVKRGRIMCNAERRRRGFTLNEICSVCGAAVEDVSHVIRDCPKAREVWLKVLPAATLWTLWISILTNGLMLILQVLVEEGKPSIGRHVLS